MSAVRIAVEGCGHGTLHDIYASVEQSCKVKGWPGVDLLIICGDFQAVRNAYDLSCVAMPAKYRQMCDFHEYYSGSRKAPYLTVFVGGNHEASNYLFELYYGGWVAENIYYMGAANVLQLGPLRIAGMSGIWKGYNYKKLHYERLPYNEDDIKSIYHVRELDTRKLLQVQGPVNIGISHDWPRGVEWAGDWKTLFRKKEHLKDDADAGQLGSVAAKLILDKLQPHWWFSGHLHCKHAAVIEHGQPASNGKAHTDRSEHIDRRTTRTQAEPDGKVVNPNEIELDLDDMDVEPTSNTTAVSNGNSQVTAGNNPDEIELDLDDVEGGPTANAALLNANIQPATSTNPDAIGLDLSEDDKTDTTVAQVSDSKTTDDNANAVDTSAPIRVTTSKKTHFLALDKCLPGRDFLQLLEYPVSTETDHKRPLKLSYDKDWLAITRSFAINERLILDQPKFNAPPGRTLEEYAKLIQEQESFINKLTTSDVQIPENFSLTAPVYDGGNIHDPQYSLAAGGLREYTNPQTTAFCKLLDIRNPFDIPEEERVERMSQGPRPASDRSAFSNGHGRNRGGRGGGFNDRRGGGRGRGRGRGKA